VLLRPRGSASRGLGYDDYEINESEPLLRAWARFSEMIPPIDQTGRGKKQINLPHLDCVVFFVVIFCFKIEVFPFWLASLSMVFS